MWAVGDDEPFGHVMLKWHRSPSEIQSSQLIRLSVSALVADMDFLNNHYEKMWAMVKGPRPFPVRSEKEEVILHAKFDAESGGIMVTLYFKHVFKNCGAAFLCSELEDPDLWHASYTKLTVTKVRSGEPIQDLDFRLMHFMIPQLSNANVITTIHFDLHTYPAITDRQPKITQFVNSLCALAEDIPRLFAVDKVMVELMNLNERENIANLDKIMNRFGQGAQVRIQRANTPILHSLLIAGMAFDGETAPLRKIDFHFLIESMAAHGDRFIAKGAQLRIRIMEPIETSVELKWLSKALANRNSFHANRIEFIAPQGRVSSFQRMFFPLAGCPHVGYLFDGVRSMANAAQKFKRVSVELDREFGLSPGMPFELKLKANKRVLIQFNESYAYCHYRMFDTPHVLEVGEHVTLKERLRISPSSGARLVFTFCELPYGSPIQPEWIKGTWIGSQIALNDAPFEVSTRVVPREEAQRDLHNQELPCHIQ
uniref:C2 tensin-type domain-containing protein n=1 Tax=Steinernema glaseri TaxID=37863 RepID=A0A1I8A9S7_9BILA